MSLRRRMILSMLSVVIISGGISSAIGGYLLWRQLNRQAENRVRQDLNAAREFYNCSLAALGNILQYTAGAERFAQAVAEKDIPYVTRRLDDVCKSAGLDILCVVDNRGKVIHRAQRPDLTGDSLANQPMVRMVLNDADVVTGTLLYTLEALDRESPSLAKRAQIPVLSTPKARLSDLAELNRGMMLCAAAPVRGSDGQLAGILRAGILLNRNYGLVDQVQNTVFRDERYRGKLIGTATIFQNDVRISTNVQREDGTRAIGTRVSAEVYDHVLRRGKTWLGPAWVVNAWYISAYEPIYDPDNNPIGMLYVGVLKDKFADLTLRTLSIFALITLAGLTVAGIAGWKLADSISRPVYSLASASAAIARGEFSQTLPVESEDEIGKLTESFNIMAHSLKERDELLKERTRQQLTRSERLAAIGRLAAGVAHEINNPLTGVLTFAHMLKQGAPAKSQQRADAETIIEATTRCRDIVRGLLDFSRQSEPNKKLSDLNAVMREAVNLTRNQAHIHRLNVIEDYHDDLPHIVADANQIQQVVLNMIVNAIDAMDNGGDLTLRTRAGEKNGEKWVEMSVSDTGSGIAPEDAEHIFDPFFTTKPTGKGTGLGLAVAYGIISEHGGTVSVESEPDKETTFVVRFPITAEE